ncbi:MAG: 50S ribosomal protein L2 [Patescibacteria group bacterium]
MSQLLLYKPTTATRRHSSVVKYNKVLTKGVKPVKGLMVRSKNAAGRNHHGKITVRHQGGGYRTKVRIIDFKREAEAGYLVKTVEYDPNRNAFISLAVNLDSGKKVYILSHQNAQVGDVLKNDGSIGNGNRIKLGDVPVGTEVCQVEMLPGKGAQIVRGAGSYAIVTANDGKYVSLKLPSGEVRKFVNTCSAVLGRMSNENYKNIRWGKAGRLRKMGVRPTVRGKVMNPVDHPHGGGEGSNPIGLKNPKTKWGKIAYGVKTRDKNKASSKLIVKRRKSR